MIPINSNQLFAYYTPEDYAVLETVSINGRQGIYLVNGAGTTLFECEDAVASEMNQLQLKTLLDSLTAIVVYDIGRLKKNNVISTFLKNYQLTVCDVGTELASLIGTWDVRNRKWLIRELDEVISFYRCEHNTKEPIERAKAILWLAEYLDEASTTELITKRSQKYRDLRKMQGYLMQVEGA